MWIVLTGLGHSHIIVALGAAIALFVVRCSSSRQFSVRCTRGATRREESLWLRPARPPDRRP